MEKRYINEARRMQELAGVKGVSESASPSDTYETKCEVDVDHYGNVTYKGMEINDVSAQPMRLEFDLDINAKSWGISSIGLYNVQGPSELDLEVWCLDESDRDFRENVTVPLDWDKVEMEKNESMGYIGLYQTVTVKLGNDSEGNLVVKSMVVEYNDL